MPDNALTDTHWGCYVFFGYQRPDREPVGKRFRHRNYIRMTVNGQLGMRPNIAAPEQAALRRSKNIRIIVNSSSEADTYLNLVIY